MNRTRYLTIGLVLALAMATLPTGAAQSTTDDAFVVTLSENGDAEVAVVTTFDLDSDEERQAFEDLRGNETAREEHATRFEERMAGVASTARERTGREMAIRDASIDFETDGDTGIVTRTVTWTRLAAVDGETLTLEAPFASGFESDRQFVVVVPDGYTADATPEPTTQDGTRLTWSAGTSLDGFSLTATASEDGGTTDALGPGFGAAGALVAITGAALLAGRRRRYPR